MQISCLPGVTLIPGSLEGLLCQVQHSSCAVIPPPNGAGSYPTGWTSSRALPHSAPLQVFPAVSLSQVSLLEHNSSSLTPKMSMRKPAELPRGIADGTRGHKPLLPPARHKAPLCLVSQRVFKELI